MPIVMLISDCLDSRLRFGRKKHYEAQVHSTERRRFLYCFPLNILLLEQVCFPGCYFSRCIRVAELSRINVECFLELILLEFLKRLDKII